MNDKQNNHSCKSCKFFIPHYTWIAGKFRPVECGHCIKRNITKKDYARFPFYDGCGQYEVHEKEIAKRQENLKEILTCMATTLNEISMLIESGYLKI